MKRCAIYARFSTEMQRTTSLEDQIRNCRKFAAQMGWEVLDQHVYQDGVELVAVADGIQTSHQMAKLQITIKGLVNELYLDDLRDKTHRGLTGRALKGRSTGGRLFGYRTRPGTEGAEWVVFEPEAAIVRRIFSMYADGLSLKAIAVTLNAEGLAFPAKATRRGPERLGWAISTIHTILANAKYEGRWVWNIRRR